MEEQAVDARNGWPAIFGFACAQCFLYAVLFVGDPSSFSPSADGRLDLLDVLVFLAAAFLLVWLSPSGFRVRLFSNRFVATCSFLPVLGLGMRVAGALSGHPELAAAEALVEGALMGFPAGVMLCAWGRVIGRFPIERSVPVVFIGSALGSALGFAVSVLPIEGAVLALQVLLVPSFLLMPAAGGRVGSRPHFRNEGGREDAAPAEEASGPEGSRSRPRVEMSAEASSLSMRILAGTCVYGLAAGLAESTLAAPAVAEASTDTFVLLLFALYCLAAIQLFGGSPLLSMRKILPSCDGSTPEDAGPLDGSYRLAVLLMLTGFLLVPTLKLFGIAGESVIFAGYMGVTTVLVSLFLVMGRISRCDSARAFAQGFTALFFGEIVGVVAGSVVGAVPGDVASTPLVALAGVAVIVAYLFLFTDRDLESLSHVVEETDLFEEACERIAADAALSKRESEILPLALRGRTSERIAAEFFISKNTVDTHMRRIYAKCGVHGRQELIDLGERVERSLRGR